MLHAVIMAGGTGRRFWPQSRRRRPKQVLPIGGRRPLIAETLLRLEGLVPRQRTSIITAAEQVAPLLNALGVEPSPHVIAEPFGRDTAACIGLAAVHVRRADPDGVMLVMPADQVIEPLERFQEVMRAGAEVAADGESLVTFGITPTYAATGYGYIHRGALVTEVGGIPVYDVAQFREKPAEETAEEYLDSGEYYWNSGIFCWRADTVLGCIERFAPDLHEALERIAGAIATPSEETVLRSAYEPLERISIDYAVMEHAETIRVVEADFAWSDVGSWASVARLRAEQADEAGNVVVGGAELLDCADVLVIGGGDHLVGAVGLEHLIVVHTPDATLVCSKDHAEKVKALVEQLADKGRTDYL
ncbi:MAG: mannose-1-phosphate guanylyltransferase [Planctomycetota bacterium]